MVRVPVPRESDKGPQHKRKKRTAQRNSQGHFEAASSPTSRRRGGDRGRPWSKDLARPDWELAYFGPRRGTSSMGLYLQYLSLSNINQQSLSQVTTQLSPRASIHFPLPLGIRNVTAARMRLPAPVLTLRPAILAGCHPIAPLVLQRSYTSADRSGSSSAAAKRRAVTPFNDNGHVPWADLSVAEKSGRAAQQTFNLGFIVVGIVLTV